MKNIGEYFGTYLYVQKDTLLLVDVFQNFQNMCLRTYKIDPACFLTSPGLAWQAIKTSKKAIMKIMMKDNLLKLMFSILIIDITLEMIYYFSWKIQNLKSLHDEEEYVIHIRNLKLASNH